MDNPKMIESELVELMHFLTHELHVDISLYWNNPNNCVRISFEDIEVIDSKKIACEVIEHLLVGTKFWVCEYGSISGSTVTQNNFINNISDTFVMPYRSEIVDLDWFEYDHNAISCTPTCLNDFDTTAYVNYCFRLDYLSNSLYLVDLLRKCVIAIYDPRGMDVASTDIAILQQISEKYTDYLFQQSD